MYVCFNCDYKSETQAKFCPTCGKPLAIVQREKPKPAYPAPERPEPVRPTYTYTYTAPTYYYPTPTYPEPCDVPIGNKIAGMVLSIVGLALAVIGLLSTLMEMDYSRGEPFAYAFAFALFSMPGSITGLSLSNRNRDNGDTSALSTVGKILGIVAVALMGFTLFIGFVAQID